MAVLLEIIIDRCVQCEYCVFDPDYLDSKYWGSHVCTYVIEPFILEKAEIEIPNNCPRYEEGL